MGATVVEHILSGRLAAPVAYDQPDDEWVTVLEGAAVLDVGDERLSLDAGDWVLLPARLHHRLVETRPGTRWLAVRTPRSADRAPPPVRPSTAGRRWTSFVADDAVASRRARALHEASNPTHRLRVEHDRHTLLIHLSDEDGTGWTTIAVDRSTRAWAGAQGPRQVDAAERAYGALYGTDPSGAA